MSTLKEQFVKKKLRKKNKFMQPINDMTVLRAMKHYDDARKYVEQGDVNKAISECSKAISISPDAEFYLFRAMSHDTQNSYELAISDYNKSIRIDPSQAHFYYWRARYYFQQSEYKQALVDYNKSISINPDNIEYYFYRGLCYLKLKNYNLACNDIDRADASTFKDRQRYFLMAQIYFCEEEQYGEAYEYIERAFEEADRGEAFHKQSYLDNIKYIAQRDLAFKETLKEKETVNQALQVKEKELNNLIAMFAHNFLGTLQCIRSNAEHENNPNIHLKTVKMMGGALTAFSIISADDDKLVEQLKQDSTGETNLSQCLANNLALAISLLLSKTNKDKIINLYLNYLKKTTQISPETNSESLRTDKDNRKKWQALQHQWDDEFNALFSEQVELNVLTDWIATNFFTLEIIGFDRYPIHFKEYAITGSIFLVILMETFVNALKYIDVNSGRPLVLTLTKENNAYQLSCENPSQQDSYRGTHKGIDFLQTIAKKLNGEFITVATETNFKSTFIIPAELLD